MVSAQDCVPNTFTIAGTKMNIYPMFQCLQFCRLKLIQPSWLTRKDNLAFLVNFLYIEKIQKNHYLKTLASDYIYIYATEKCYYF